MTSKETRAKPENSALQKSADVVAKGVFKSDKGEYNYGVRLLFPILNEEMKMIIMRVEAWKVLFETIDIECCYHKSAHYAWVGAF